MVERERKKCQDFNCFGLYILSLFVVVVCVSGRVNDRGFRDLFVLFVLLGCYAIQPLPSSAVGCPRLTLWSKIPVHDSVNGTLSALRNIRLEHLSGFN